MTASGHFANGALKVGLPAGSGGPSHQLPPVTLGTKHSAREALDTSIFSNLCVSGDEIK
jgi:hypothetical protein